MKEGISVQEEGIRCERRLRGGGGITALLRYEDGKGAPPPPPR